MVPVVLDISKVKTAIAGEGVGALGRLRFLAGHGAVPAAVFAPAPSVALRAEAGGALVDRWPGPEDLRGIHVLFAAGLDAARADEIAGAARVAKTLLNTEDVTALCDIHVPASVRRGALLLTVSTDGQAPGLARKLRNWLARAFGPEWEERAEEIASARSRLRAEGVAGPALAAAVDRLLDEKGWLQ